MGQGVDGLIGSWVDGSNLGGPMDPRNLGAPPQKLIRDGFGVAGGRVGRGALPTNQRPPQPYDHLLKQGSAD